MPIGINTLYNNIIVGSSDSVFILFKSNLRFKSCNLKNFGVKEVYTFI